MTSDRLATGPGEAETGPRRGPHWVALFAAAFTFPLLFVGGSVTSFGVGLAVPDWPTTFHINMFLYDFWNAPFGVRVEHSHRLYGAAVGMATLFLAAWFLAFERRRFMKVLGVSALAAVVVQGVLGGSRVTQVSTTLAAVHGVIGQAFFGLLVVLCVLTGRGWVCAGPARPDPARLRRRSALMLALVYAQIAVGAWFRHYGSVAALATHVGLAAVVLGYGAFLAAAVGRSGVEAQALRPSSRAMAVVVTLQVVLGLVALWVVLPIGGNPRAATLWQAMLRTAHQTNGALLAAASVVLTLRSFRHFGPATTPVPPSPSRPAPAPRNLEAVA